MNFFSFLFIKLISILTIWTPNYDIVAKKYLTVIFVIKLFVDFSMIKQHGEQGIIKKAAKKISPKYGHIMANLLHLMLNVFMAFVAFKTEAWIPAVMATIMSVAVLFDIKRD